MWMTERISNTPGRLDLGRNRASRRPLVRSALGHLARGPWSVAPHDGPRLSPPEDTGFLDLVAGIMGVKGAAECATECAAEVCR